MKIFVTVPAYNEQDTISGVVANISKVMRKERYRGRVIVVDDGSTDKTAQRARQAGAFVVSHPKNYGLAEAFRTEVRECLKQGADVIVHIDADAQYLPQEIPKLVAEIHKGNDLVLGSRFLGKIESMPLIKRLGNRAFSGVISYVTKTKISDAQTGFRAFTRAVAERIEIGSTHTYTQEQILRAARMKFRIAEVPVYFARRHDSSRLISSPFGYAARAWINILRIFRDYEPLKFFSFIGGAFLFVVFILGLYLVYRFLTIGIVGRMPTVILDMLLITAGFQVILFGFLADMFRK